jgi:malonyl-CoA O-methyltransferase
LFDEVGSRLLEHLDSLKLQPERILDLGCATGRVAAALHQRYPKAQVFGIDPASALLKQSPPACVTICAYPEQLPVRARSFDLLVCNLGAYWCAIDALLPELLRAAAPGALLLLSTFGPDTLQQLRIAFKGVDNYRHVMSFIDMHDIGDALGRTGFAEPIMQMDRLTLTYADLDQLTSELAALGMRNFSSDRPRSLYGKHKWQAVVERYRPDGAGLIPATFEIIYAIAWKPLQAQRLPDGSQIIGFQPARKR